MTSAPTLSPNSANERVLFTRQEVGFNFLTKGKLSSYTDGLLPENMATFQCYIPKQVLDNSVISMHI